jgi:hypothetical protein
MPLKVDIPDSQIERAKEFYSSIADDVLGRLTTAYKEWQEIEPTLTQLGLKFSLPFATFQAPLSIATPPLNGYDKKWSWSKKATYVLKKKGPLTAKEIVDSLIAEYEPKLSRETALNSIPATLSVDARNGKFRREAKEDGEYVYSTI